jgi:hypothetical protein
MSRFRSGPQKGRIRSWEITSDQNLLLKLFDLSSNDPKLGPSKARGSLLIGDIEQAYDFESGDFTFKRKRRVAPLTPYNLACHFGYFQRSVQFFQAAVEAGTTPPDEVIVGAREHIQKRFANEITVPLRAYLQEMGHEGVTCYLYVCPTIESYADPDTGRVRFQYGDWPLCIVPHSMNKSQAAWGLDDKLLAELALTAGWLVFRKLTSLRMINSLDEAQDVFGDWREALPSAEVLDHLNVIGRRALLGEGAEMDD